MVLTHLVLFSFFDGASAGEVTPPVVVVPDVAAPAISGVKRRPYRVKRSDFSSQEAYELALKMAMAEARFAVVPAPDEVVPPPPREKRQQKRVVGVDKSLSLDTDIKLSHAEFLRLQKAADMEEMELLAMFVKMIEDRW